MKCAVCGSRFPYAEVYIFYDENCGSHWTYLCKKCYKDDRAEVNSNGYYELTRLERFCVTTNITLLKWKLSDIVWSIKYKLFKKKYDKKFSELKVYSEMAED